MNKWITDRLPTENDADENGNVWVTALDGSVLCTPYGWVNLDAPWMAKQKIDRPEPYVKPELMKRWKPDNGQKSYYLASHGMAFVTFNDEDFVRQQRYHFGNCFRTQAQAKEAARRVRETLLNYHKELNNAA